MLFDGPLELGEAGTAWHPVLPAKDLPAYRGKSVAVTEEYLRNAASETLRYYGDLEARGVDYKRPILVGHNDGLRLGSLLDFDVREFEGFPTLFVKSRWLPSHWGRLMAGEYERGSIRIVPKHTDPQTGETYGPFIDEFSVTEKPVIKDYRLTDVTSPEALAAVGLALSEEETAMTEEPNEVELAEEEGGEEGGGSALSQLLDSLLAMMAQLTAEIQELKGLKPSEEEEGGEEEGEEIAASEEGAEMPPSPEIPADVVVELADIKAELGRMKRATKLNNRERGTGSGSLELGERKMSQAQAITKAKGEGLTGIAAVLRAKELRGEK